MTYFEFIAIVCLGVIFIVLIWNIINDYKRSKSKVGLRIDESKYYELKYKFQYITAIFPLLIAIIAFIGNKEVSTISDSIRAELKPKMDSTSASIEALKVNSSALQDSLKRLDMNFKELDNKYSRLASKDEQTNRKIGLTSNSAEDLSRRINNIMDAVETIEGKDIVKNGVYVIRDVFFNKRQSESMKYYFKDLKRSNGQNLPKFTKPPILYIVGVKDEEYKFTEITTEYVELWMFSARDENVGHTFNMLIIE